MRKIRFIVNVVKWFDKVNGNTYHSVNIMDLKKEKAYKSNPMVYGYGSQYECTVLDILLKNKALPRKYNKDNVYMYTRENNYPIIFNVDNGLKRDMINNVREV